MSSASSTVVVSGFSQSTSKPLLEEGLGDLVMRGVGGGDGDEVERGRARALAGEHLPPVAIGAVRGDAEPDGEIAAARRIDIERAGGEFEGAVEAGGDAVGSADLAAFAAADQSPVQSVMCLTRDRRT